jgi:hypothetical protein
MLKWWVKWRHQMQVHAAPGSGRRRALQLNLDLNLICFPSTVSRAAIVHDSSPTGVIYSF